MYPPACSLIADNRSQDTPKNPIPQKHGGSGTCIDNSRLYQTEAPAPHPATRCIASGQAVGPFCLLVPAVIGWRHPVVIPTPSASSG